MSGETNADASIEGMRGHWIGFDEYENGVNHTLCPVQSPDLKQNEHLHKGTTC